MPEAVSKELNDKVLRLIETVRNSGKLRKGTNESTKAIEKGIAKLVVIAGDVEPPEVVMHLPALCEEKNIPCVYVSSKMELGRAAGIDVPSAAISVVDLGKGKDLFSDVEKELSKKKA